MLAGVIGESKEVEGWQIRKMLSVHVAASFWIFQLSFSVRT
jgi:hypothetical protein